MTQQEFEARAIKVTATEFDAINYVYMASDVDKDEFCKLWCKMNATRVKRFKEQQKKEEQLQDLKFELSHIVLRAYTFAQSCEIADNYFTKREKSLISKAMIDLEDKKANAYVNADGVIDYIPAFKSVGQVLSEIREFIAA